MDAKSMDAKSMDAKKAAGKVGATASAINPKHASGSVDYEDGGAKIKVVGVGGGGTNAINTMITSGVESVSFIAINTDRQSLRASLSPVTIQIGKELTKGLGAGANPDVGRDATLEDRHEIMEAVGGADMVFVTAGMGGGTGTGGASVVAQIARESGALTVGVVTRPFVFEGRRRSRHADIGIERLRENVDTLIVIPNEKLLHTVAPDTSLLDAFKIADQVLLDAVRGISDIINIPGTINVDFADVKTVMSKMGQALMGIGYGEGEGRALHAAKQAISSPLLDDVDVEGATGVLINVTASPTVGILELNEACSVIHEAAHEDANIIMGAVIDEEMSDGIRVTVIATGFPVEDSKSLAPGSMFAPPVNVLSNMDQDLKKWQRKNASPAPLASQKPGGASSSPEAPKVAPAAPAPAPLGAQVQQEAKPPVATPSPQPPRTQTFGMPAQKKSPVAPSWSSTASRSGTGGYRQQAPVAPSTTQPAKPVAEQGATQQMQQASPESQGAKTEAGKAMNELASGIEDSIDNAMLLAGKNKADKADDLEIPTFLRGGNGGNLPGEKPPLTPPASPAP